MANAEWKTVLGPYDQVFSNLNKRVQELTDEQLEELYEACKQPTKTNCWWITFHAARFLMPWVCEEIRERHLDHLIAQKG